MRTCRVLLLLIVTFFAGMRGFEATGYAEEAAAPAAAGETQPEQENYFLWVLRMSGVIGIVILCLSFYFITLITQRYMDLREQVTSPPEVVAQCQAFIEQRNFRELFTLVKAEGSYFSKMLSAGLSELPQGMHEAREAMDRVGDTETVEMEVKISMFAVLGSLGPMIGLLGTLKGMIGSFEAIARAGTQLKAAEVAGHISEALLLTFEGVALSVPAIYFYAFFKNRVSRLSTAGALKADEMLRQVSAALKTKAPRA